MTKEFNLSSKIIKPRGQINQILCPMIPEEDVKEFIKKLKKKLPKFSHNDAGESWNQYGIIDKLAGDDLL